ncbi:hypothetical protein EDC01DRAFT_698222 [Geopyxis carbonaria]|nr:hypothetical protein EDC01DRAFT_698222 [Geopyxis carbonaria]
MTSSFEFKTILMIGATSGIGWALAERFLAEGRKVIVVGRREDKLDAFLAAHGGAGPKLASYVFDVTKLSEIPAWAEQVTREHPDLDCVFANAGIQRGFNFSKPASVDLGMLDTEMLTNYTACIHLTKAFLPHLLAQPTASLAYVSSGLALVPLGRCPNYCASKAALHHFLMSLRAHLAETSVRVIELMPPAVQTELHDAAVQPDIKNGREIGMEIGEFVDETWRDLVEGREHDEYPIGWAKKLHAAIEPARREVGSVLPMAPAEV